MPIYEYRCTNCGFQKEYLQKLSDAPLTDCPECGKAALSKMLTAAGFQLKGSGWYVTDFKNGAAPKAKPADKGDTKADEKPAAKEEAAPAAAAAAPAPAKTETPAAKPAAPAATPVADS